MRSNMPRELVFFEKFHWTKGASMSFVVIGETMPSYYIKTEEKQISLLLYVPEIS